MNRNTARISQRVKLPTNFIQIAPFLFGLFLTLGVDACREELTCHMTGNAWDDRLCLSREPLEVLEEVADALVQPVIR